MDAKKIVIETDQLTKSFGKFTAVKNLSLRVPEKSIVGFLGPNGAGKSTTIKLLLGLSQPTSGNGSVFGMDIKKDSQDIRRRVGYLAQNPRFYDHMTAREIMDFSARFFMKSPDGLIRERIEESLELVGLTGKLDRPVKGFSGGERQRLGIAQAQINHPDLLILDEPAAALDPQGRRDVLEIMEKLREKTTIFFSTHILDDVQRVSDMVIILNRGELIAQGPIQEMISASHGLSYRIVVKNGQSAVEQSLQNMPWVSDVTMEHLNGSATFIVNVSDETEAENKLLRGILKDPDVQVTAFSRNKQNLEEVFISLVEGAAQ